MESLKNFQTEEELSNNQMSKVVGGFMLAKSTTYTSSTTSKKYEDTKNADGTETIHWNKPIA